MSDITELLNALGPVLAASAAIIAGLAAIIKNFPKIRRLISTDQTALIVQLRELADTRLEMVDQLKTQLADEKAVSATKTADLEFARRSADESVRQRQQAWDLLEECRGKKSETRP